MAVFVAASDESAGRDSRLGMFVHGGFIASVTDWIDRFSPEWEERVLLGPPTIKSFHMTEMRNAVWREDNYLSAADAEYRIDEAVRIVGSHRNSMLIVSSQVDASVFRNRLGTIEMRRSRSNQYATDKLQPDHICFLAFAFTALLCTVNAYPDVEKIDFVVHKKREVSSSIDDFHAMLKQHLEDIGYPNLSNLVGEIIQGNDDRVPLQAADLACWHIQKYVTRTLDEKDINHFKTIAVERIGYMHQWTDDDIDAFTKPPQAPARSEGMLAIERLIGAGI